MVLVLHRWFPSLLLQQRDRRGSGGGGHDDVVASVVGTSKTQEKGGTDSGQTDKFDSQELLTESVDLTKFVGPLPFSA
jgi:hypothetical protein